MARSPIWISAACATLAKPTAMTRENKRFMGSFLRWDLQLGFAARLRALARAQSTLRGQKNRICASSGDRRRAGWRGADGARQSRRNALTGFRRDARVRQRRGQCRRRGRDHGRPVRHRQAERTQQLAPSSRAGSIGCPSRSSVTMPKPVQITILSPSRPGGEPSALTVTPSNAAASKLNTTIQTLTEAPTPRCRRVSCRSRSYVRRVRICGSRSQRRRCAHSTEQFAAAQRRSARA